jgi:hypothetical protein
VAATTCQRLRVMGSGVLGMGQSQLFGFSIVR